MADNSNYTKKIYVLLFFLSVVASLFVAKLLSSFLLPVIFSIFLALVFLPIIVTITQKTDWNYNSETGILSGNVVTVAGTTTTENKIETAAPAIDRESKSTGLNFYIEPALRLGWKF